MCFKAVKRLTIIALVMMLNDVNDVSNMSNVFLKHIASGLFIL